MFGVMLWLAGGRQLRRPGYALTSRLYLAPSPRDGPYRLTQGILWVVYPLHLINCAILDRPPPSSVPLLRCPLTPYCSLAATGKLGVPALGSRGSWYDRLDTTWHAIGRGRYLGCGASECFPPSSCMAAVEPWLASQPLTWSCPW